jgi:hypothetical protein
VVVVSVEAKRVCQLTGACVWRWPVLVGRDVAACQQQLD